MRTRRRMGVARAVPVAEMVSGDRNERASRQEAQTRCGSSSVPTRVMNDAQQEPQNDRRHRRQWWRRHVNEKSSAHFQHDDASSQVLALLRLCARRIGVRCDRIWLGRAVRLTYVSIRTEEVHPLQNWELRVFQALNSSADDDKSVANKDIECRGYIPYILARLPTVRTSICYALHLVVYSYRYRYRGFERNGGCKYGFSSYRVGVPQRYR